VYLTLTQALDNQLGGVPFGPAGTHEPAQNTFGRFFAPAPAPVPASPRRAQKHSHKAETIKRVFELQHTGYPGAGVRTVMHLQYLEWPDMNVPTLTMLRMTAFSACLTSSGSDGTKHSINYAYLRRRGVVIGYHEAVSFI
jgi:hypothetical protein